MHLFNLEAGVLFQSFPQSEHLARPLEGAVGTRWAGKDTGLIQLPDAVPPGLAALAGGLLVGVSLGLARERSLSFWPCVWIQAVCVAALIGARLAPFAWIESLSSTSWGLIASVAACALVLAWRRRSPSD